MGAFFVRDGDRFVPTELTRGPWSEHHQHGGPPSALLARELSRALAAPLARVSIEMLKPAPLAPLIVESEPEGGGKKVQRASARLLGEGSTVLARASALTIRASEGDVEIPAGPEIPPPDALPPLTFPFFPWETAYHRAVEARLARGAWGTTPITLWARCVVDLVLGEPITPLEQLFALVDAESGMGPPLDVARFTFVNPDLVVHLARAPVGAWLGLEVLSFAGARGAGVASSTLFDRAGLVGRAAQALVIEAREGARAKGS